MSKNDRTGTCCMDIINFLDRHKAYQWGTQNIQGFCFLNFDPHTLRIKVCRWGCTKRPPNTDKRMWFRLDFRSYIYTNDVIEAITGWSRFWGGFIFDGVNSEPPPPSYPNALEFSKVVHIKKPVQTPLIPTKNKSPNIFEVCY